MPAAADDPLIGSVLSGRYRIEGLLGEGGVGRVYRAVQTSLGRLVAVKVLHPDIVPLDDRSAERFLREAATLARLSHPHTVRVFDYGRVDDLHFLVMEYVAGPTLTRLVAEGPLTVPQTCRLGEQIAMALYEAHERGVIHRDLKPSNVLVTGSGGAESAKVIDFGLAKPLRADGDLTREGIVVGTPRYLAPEVLAGDAPDTRVDVYGLGLLLHVMLTARHPFRGDSGAREVMVQILTKAPPRLRTIRDDVPEALDDLVARCLAKEPDERPESMLEVAKALRRTGRAWRALTGDGTPAVQPLVDTETADGLLGRAVTGARTPPAATRRSRFDGASTLAAVSAFLLGFAGVAVALASALRIAGMW